MQQPDQLPNVDDPMSFERRGVSLAFEAPGPTIAFASRAEDVVALATPFIRAWPGRTLVLSTGALSQNEVVTGLGELGICTTGKVHELLDQWSPLVDAASYEYAKEFANHLVDAYRRDTYVSMGAEPLTKEVCSAATTLLAAYMHIAVIDDTLESLPIWLHSGGGEFISSTTIETTPPIANDLQNVWQMPEVWTALAIARSAYMRCLGDVESVDYSDGLIDRFLAHELRHLSVHIEQPATSASDKSDLGALTTLLSWLVVCAAEDAISSTSAEDAALILIDRPPTESSFANLKLAKKHDSRVQMITIWRDLIDLRRASDDTVAEITSAHALQVFAGLTSDSEVVSHLRSYGTLPQVDNEQDVAWVVHGGAVAAMRLNRLASGISPAIHMKDDATIDVTDNPPRLDGSRSAGPEDSLLTRRVRANFGAGYAAEELHRTFADRSFPPQVAERVDALAQRLQTMPSISHDREAVTLQLNAIANFPWKGSRPEWPELADAAGRLEEDLYGMVEAKQRAMEYLALRRLGSRSATILCLEGVPGTGKTHFARSLGRALGRPAVTISCAGVHEPSFFRGHTTTYAGYQAGAFAKALTEAGSRDAVIILDELDKMGVSYHGDPAAVLLAALDPGQNGEFRDHFMELALDLSSVLFVATANFVNTIPEPLLDRMEVLHVSPYGKADQKLIVRQHLLPKSLRRNALAGRGVDMTDEAISALVDNHCAEGGLRSVERALDACLRKVAVAIASGEPGSTIDVDDIPVTVTVVRTPEHLRTAVMTAVPGSPPVHIDCAVVPGHGRVLHLPSVNEVPEATFRAWSAARAAYGDIDWERRDITLRTTITAFDGFIGSHAYAVAIAAASMQVSLPRDVAVLGSVSLSGIVAADDTIGDALAGLCTYAQHIIVPRESAGVIANLDVDQLARTNVLLSSSLVESLRLLQELR